MSEVNVDIFLVEIAISEADVDESRNTAVVLLVSPFVILISEQGFSHLVQSVCSSHNTESV